MKILVLGANQSVRDRIKQQLAELNHIVVAEPLNRQALLIAVVRLRPHAIVAGELPPVIDAKALGDFGGQLPAIPVICFPADETDEAAKSYLDGALQNVALLQAAEKIRPYSSNEQRLVLQDDRHQTFAQAEKLGSASVSPADATREADIFIRQVNCALKNHAAARHYLAQVVKTDQGLRVECAYRTVHASYKVCWLREHAMRWAGVLAHYIEGVEKEYLPPPASPSSTLDFLHYEPPAESLYAASALISHGFRAGLVPGFRAILNVKFTGQPEELLSADAIILFGWCALLREIALAQIQIMDEILDPGSDWHARKKPTRRIHRAEGIFGDFWALPSLRQYPSRMRDLAYLAAVKWITPSSPGPAIAPFRDFLRAHHAANGNDPVADNSTSEN
jgi:hypothetical protein